MCPCHFIGGGGSEREGEREKECTHEHAVVYLWRSEDSLWEWLSPFTVGSRDQTQVVRFEEEGLLLAEPSFTL